MQNPDDVFLKYILIVQCNAHACTSSCFMFAFLDVGVLQVNHSSFDVHNFKNKRHIWRTIIKKNKA